MPTLTVIGTVTAIKTEIREAQVVDQPFHRFEVVEVTVNPPDYKSGESRPGAIVRLNVSDREHVRIGQRVTIIFEDEGT